MYSPARLSKRVISFVNTQENSFLTKNPWNEKPTTVQNHLLGVTCSTFGTRQRNIGKHRIRDYDRDINLYV